MILNKDYVGAMCSFLCLLHCLAVPVLLALGVTVAGQTILGDERIHLFLTAPIVMLALWSIPHGLRSHRQWAPAVAASVGLVALFLGLALEPYELILTLVATILLIFAHLFNRRILLQNAHE